MAYKRDSDRKQYMHDWYIRNRARVIRRSTAYNRRHRTRRLRRYRQLYAARYRRTKVMKTYDDHQTKRVRGRICHRCNLALGLLGDTVEGVVNALKYLRKI